MLLFLPPDWARARAGLPNEGNMGWNRIGYWRLDWEGRLGGGLVWFWWLNGVVLHSLAELAVVGFLLDL